MAGRPCELKVIRRNSRQRDVGCDPGNVLMRFKKAHSGLSPVLGRGKMRFALAVVASMLLINCGRSSPATSDNDRSEEHTSELQSLMRISYAVFCLKKKKRKTKL